MKMFQKALAGVALAAALAGITQILPKTQPAPAAGTPAYDAWIDAEVCRRMFGERFCALSENERRVRLCEETLRPMLISPDSYVRTSAIVRVAAAGTAAVFVGYEAVNAFNVRLPGTIECEQSAEDLADRLPQVTAARLDGHVLAARDILINRIIAAGRVHAAP